MWRTVWYKFSVLICGMSFKPQQSASMTLSNSSHVPRGKEQSALSWPLSQTDNPWKPGQPSSLKPYRYSFRYTLRAGAVNLPTRQASPARDTSLCHASPLSAFSLVLDPPVPTNTHYPYPIEQTRIVLLHKLVCFRCQSLCLSSFLTNPLEHFMINPQRLTGVDHTYISKWPENPAALSTEVQLNFFNAVRYK